MGHRGPHSTYEPKEPPPRSYRLTRLAKRALDAARERCGVPESTIVEHLVRLHVGEVRPEEFRPLTDDASAAA